MLARSLITVHTMKLLIITLILLQEVKTFYLHYLASSTIHTILLYEQSLHISSYHVVF